MRCVLAYEVAHHLIEFPKIRAKFLDPYLKAVISTLGEVERFLSEISDSLGSGEEKRGKRHSVGCSHILLQRKPQR